MQTEISNKTGASADDVRLANDVLRKDRKATAEFVERYSDSLYSYVRWRLMPSADVVEDLVQEVFLAAWHSLPNFRGDSSLQGWLLGIARHKIKDYYRKRLRELETEEGPDDDYSMPDTLPQMEEQLDSKSEQEKVHRILARLPEMYRLVLLWRYMEQYSAQEMAGLLGKTEKAVERLLARARDRFRKEWNSAGA